MIKIKFVTKLPSADTHITEQLIKQQWHTLKEPKTMTQAFLQSIPYMLIAGACSVFIIHQFSPFKWSDFGIDPVNGVLEMNIVFIIWIVVLLVIHESLHLFFVPKFWASENTYFGITYFGGFIYTTDIISKRRFLFITIIPFVLLSIVLPIILGIFGLLTSTIKLLIVLNALGSSVDLLNFKLITQQIPAGASIRNNGLQTYWKFIE